MVATSFRAILLSVVLFRVATTLADTRHVDAVAPAGGDGTTWLTAMNDLQQALDFARAGDEIRVAGGVYLPSKRVTVSDPRSATFQLASGVIVRGGFGGVAAADPDARDLELFETIFSGDIGVAESPADNTYHVVYLFFASAVQLDGVTIRRGVGGDAAGSSTRYGAGLHAQGSTVEVRDCRFELNIAPDSFGWGAGVFHQGGVADYSNCQFEDNGDVNTSRGGALHAREGATVRLRDCRFARNFARTGGAAMLDATVDSWFVRCDFEENATLRNGSSVGDGGAVSVQRGARCTFVECRFVNNSTSASGGAVNIDCDARADFFSCRFLGNRADQGHLMSGGAIFSRVSAPKFINCAFSGNQAQEGGALFVTTLFAAHCGGTASSGALISNSTICNNSAQVGGGITSEALGSGNRVRVDNTIIWENLDQAGAGQGAQVALLGGLNGVFDHCVIQGWDGTLDGVQNLGLDPLMLDIDGGDDLIGTRDDDFRVAADSPAVDAGSNSRIAIDTADLDSDADVLEAIPIDVVGNPRRADVPLSPDLGSGAAPLVDIGAHEAPPCPGDLDGDFDIDLLDLARLISNFGLAGSATVADGDLDGDRDVDVDDLSGALARYSLHCL